MKTAFIGLGVMGYPMAGYLVKGGHDTVVYNRTTTRAQQWVAEFGGSSAATPREAAAGADIVFACVGNDDDVREVLLGDDGALAGLTAGATLVDHTTASAEIARESLSIATVIKALTRGVFMTGGRRCGYSGCPGSHGSRSRHTYEPAWLV